MNLELFTSGSIQKLMRVTAKWGRWSVVMTIMITVALTGCENYQPESEKVISELDRTACNLLYDTLIVPVETSVVTDLQADWIEAHDTSVASLYDTLRLATACEVTYSLTGGDTSYAFFENDLDDLDLGEVVFALNDYLEIELLRKNGDVIHYTSNIIPIETVAGCFRIKTRLLFVADRGNYLVRFIRTEAALGSVMRLAILQNRD